jgi:hypothetical protein
MTQCQAYDVQILLHFALGQTVRFECPMPRVIGHPEARAVAARLASQSGDLLRAGMTGEEVEKIFDDFEKPAETKPADWSEWLT